CQTTTPFESLTMNIRVAGWPNWSKAKLSVEPTRNALPSAAVATAVATSAPVPPHVVSVSETCPCAGLSISASRTKPKLANSIFPTSIPFRRAGLGLHVCVMAFLLFGAKRTKPHGYKQHLSDPDSIPSCWLGTARMRHGVSHVWCAKDLDGAD